MLNLTSRRKQIHRIDERVLLKKIVDYRCKDKGISAAIKSDIELMVWHNFKNEKNKIMENYSGKANYNTYCLAVFARMVETLLLSSRNIAV